MENKIRKIGKRITSLKAIRIYCLDCCCDSWHEVRLCPSVNCSLYPFLLGHNPNYAKKGSHLQETTVQLAGFSITTGKTGNYTSDELDTKELPSMCHFSRKDEFSTNEVIKEL